MRELPLAGVGGEASGKDPADLVFTQGRIYTVSAGQPWATVIAIRDRIVDAVACGLHSSVRTRKQRSGKPAWG